MALERTYIIPLRKEWLKVPRYKRAKKAVIAVRKFLSRHMKSETIKLGPKLNQELWMHGMKNPPCKIRVNTVKDDKGIVTAELFGALMPKKEEKKEAKKGLAGKLVEKLTGKEMPKIEKKESKKEKTKNKLAGKKSDEKKLEKKKPEPVKEEKKPEANPAEKKDESK